MIKPKEGYSQVCVWPGMTIEEKDIKEFESLMFDRLGAKIQYLETIVTKPDIKNGIEVLNTGGRHDVFFGVHEDSIPQFAASRLVHGIRWLEDVLANCNYRCHIYPDHVYNYITWNEEAIDFPEGVCCAL
jgi:hypothetical protein